MAKTNRPAAMGVSVQPIGHVRKQADRTWIVLEPQYQPGLLGLEGFSHIHVLWWFHLNDTPEKRATLQVHPRSNPQNPLTGVFATRSPVRPNLIGLTLCRIVAIRPLELELETIDAFDGTPVLDIKPFIPAFDTARGVRAPDWIKDGLRPPSDGPKAGRKLSAPRPPGSHQSAPDRMNDCEMPLQNAGREEIQEMGIVYNAAAERARAAGLKVVMGRCIMVEHRNGRPEPANEGPSEVAVGLRTAPMT